MQTGSFKDGQKSGVWRRYHENGVLWDEGEYRADKRTGEWKTYDPDGVLTATKTHRT